MIPIRAPVVFLDIDGVLNHAMLYAQLQGRHGSTEPVDWIDPACVARLDALCERTGAVIVLSSSWRRIFGVEHTFDVLRAAGLATVVIDGTPMHGATEPGENVVNERWGEIRAWLDEHDTHASWVILDDAELADAPAERFVRTSIAVGLTDADVERAVAILGPAPAAPRLAPLAGVVDFDRAAGRLIAYAASAMPVGAARCPHCRRRIALLERRDGSLVLRLHRTEPNAFDEDGVVQFRGEPCPLSMRAPSAIRGDARPPYDGERASA